MNNSLFNQPVVSVPEGTQNRMYQELPSRVELRSSKKLANRKPRALCAVATFAAAILTTSVISPTPSVTLALWNDTLSIPMQADPLSEFVPVDPETVLPPALGQDGKFCLYFDDFHTNGIRRAEVKFTFGDLTRLVVGNPKINLQYAADVRNFTNRAPASTSNNGPAITFLNAPVNYALGTGRGTSDFPNEPNPGMAGVFVVPTPATGSFPTSHPQWFYSTIPTGNTTTGNNPGANAEFVNPGRITANLNNLELVATNAQVVMYAQDRMYSGSGTSRTYGLFSGYIEPSTLHFTLTGVATQALLEYVEYSSANRQQFADRNMTISGSATDTSVPRVFTWTGSIQTPGFYDNNGHTDTVGTGNGRACELVRLPVAPTGLTASRSATNASQVYLTWTAPTDLRGLEIQYYQVYRYTDSRTWLQLNDATPQYSTNGLETSLTVTVPTTTASYYFWVRAVTAQGFGAWSNVSGYSLGTTAFTSLARYGGTVALNWTQVTGATGYDIYWTTGTSRPAANVSLNQTAGNANQNSVSISSGSTVTTNVAPTGAVLAAANSYNFWIRAKSTSGNTTTLGEWSTVAMTAGSVPAARTGLTATRGVQGTNGVVDLTWTAGTTTGITSYQIYFAAWPNANQTPTAPTDTVSLTNSNSRTKTNQITTGSYQVTGLSTNTYYAFWIRALNANGASAWSTNSARMNSRMLVSADLLGQSVEEVTEYLASVNLWVSDAVLEEYESETLGPLARTLAGRRTRSRSSEDTIQTYVVSDILDTTNGVSVVGAEVDEGSLLQLVVSAAPEPEAEADDPADEDYDDPELDDELEVYLPDTGLEYPGFETAEVTEPGDEADGTPAIDDAQPTVPEDTEDAVEDSDGGSVPDDENSDSDEESDGEVPGFDGAQPTKPEEIDEIDGSDEYDGTGSAESEDEADELEDENGLEEEADQNPEQTEDAETDPVTGDENSDYADEAKDENFDLEACLAEAAKLAELDEEELYALGLTVPDCEPVTEDELVDDNLFAKESDYAVTQEVPDFDLEDED